MKPGRCNKMIEKINQDGIRLRDIVNAIDDIHTAHQKGFKDRVNVMAAAYGIAIIGEAANKLSSDLKEQNSKIPWRSIINMRNVIIHDYGNVSVIRIQSVIKDYLPELKKQILQMLSKLN